MGRDTRAGEASGVTTPLPHLRCGSSEPCPVPLSPHSFAAYSVAGDTLTVRMLNTKVVKKDVNSSDELAKAIADNKDRPDIFGDKMVLTKVNK